MIENVSDYTWKKAIDFVEKIEEADCKLPSDFEKQAESFWLKNEGLAITLSNFVALCRQIHEGKKRELTEFVANELD